MILDSNGNEFSAQGSALSVNQSEQITTEITLSSNIANVETPYYQRVDVNPGFASELKRAISTQNVDTVGQVKAKISIDQTAVALNRDGNTVQLEKELVLLQKNMIAHQLQTKMITGKLTSLRKAITGI